MPRNVRNFWIEADIDGRKSRFASGPVRKDGGFDLTIYIRDDGSVKRALSVTGRAYGHGEIRLTVCPERLGVVRAEGGTFAWDHASEIRIEGRR